MSEQPAQPWSVLRRERLVDSRWVQVDREAVALPDGLRIDDYYVVREPDFAMVLAVTEEAQAILVRQYKHGIGRPMLELPAGYLEAGDASAGEAIQRELREETGFEAALVQPLAALVTSPTRSPSRGHYFLATGCRHVSVQALDPAERIEIVLAPVAALGDLVASGQIDGLSSVACIALGLTALAQRGPDGSASGVHDPASPSHRRS